MNNFNKPSYESTSLIVDGAHALRRSMYQPSYRELSTSSGMPTGAIYGVCRILCSLQNKFGATSIVMSLEGGHSERRQSLYPDYKKRDGVDEVQSDTGMTDFEYYIHQQSWIRKLVESLGIHVVSVQGKEGDDTIFQLSHLIKGKKIVVSEDKDFYTLISPTISVYRPIRDEHITYENFTEATGYASPVHYLYAKVLLGDGSDNIPAVCKGVGEKTVADVLSKIDSSDLSYKSLIESASSFTASRYKKLAMLEESVFNRNMDLIDISREPFTVPELMSIISSLKRDIAQSDIAEKLMRVLEFSDVTKIPLRELGAVSQTTPVKYMINDEYVREVIEGTATPILGGDV